MTAGPTIDYEALAQEAMRGLVRNVLSRAAKSGLPGDHHFYVSFDTQAAGVVMSKRLREKYPSEMTIVLQHRFWDLQVTDERFEVKLTFDGIPERLVVPFTAIKVFFDPSVRYGLQFEDPHAADAGGGAEQGRDDGRDDTSSQRAGATAPRAPTRKPRPRPAKPQRVDKELASADAAAEVPSKPGPAEPTPSARPAASLVRPALAPVPQPAASERSAGPGAPATPPEDAANKPSPAPAAGAQIVSLDAFRKK